MAYCTSELERKKVDPLAIKLRQWRKSHPGARGKFTRIDELAQRLEMSKEMLGRIELGDVPIRPRYRVLIEQFLSDNP